MALAADLPASHPRDLEDGLSGFNPHVLRYGTGCALGGRAPGGLSLRLGRSNCALPHPLQASYSSYMVPDLIAHPRGAADHDLYVRPEFRRGAVLSPVDAMCLI